MSGQVVLTPMIQPSVLIPAGLGAGAGLAALALASSVKLLVKNRLEAAHGAQQKERAKSAAWLAHLASQLEKTQLYRTLEQAVQESEKQLAALQLAEAGSERAERAAAHDEPQPVHDYAAIGKHRLAPDEMAALVEEVGRILSELPAEFREAEGSSYPALARQMQQFSQTIEAGGKVRAEEVAHFKNLIASALSSFADEIKSAEKFRQEINNRLQAALDDVLFYQQLASAQFLPDLNSLHQQLTGLLQAPEVRRGQLELVERKLAELRSAIDAEVVLTAHRDGLCESILNNLHEMGYQILEDFSAENTGQLRQATVRIPGGELVQMALHPNNQLGLQLIHERKHGLSGPVKPEELAHIRRQEKRWCNDFKELVRRLVADGFPYEVKFEDILPEKSVKVAVVETAEDILAQEAEQAMQLDDQAAQRYLDQP